LVDVAYSRRKRQCCVAQRLASTWGKVDGGMACYCYIRAGSIGAEASCEAVVTFAGGLRAGLHRAR
jgi:uncharacterized RmlC-like cupin family protein